RRGDVRICAVIDVEKCALRAFKEDSFAALKGAMKINYRVADKRAQLFPGGEITFVYLAKIDRLCPERLEDAVVLENFGLQLFPRRSIHDGIRCRMYLAPRWMTVWPALFPP